MPLPCGANFLKSSSFRRKNFKIKNFLPWFFLKIKFFGAKFGKIQFFWRKFRKIQEILAQKFLNRVFLAQILCFWCILRCVKKWHFVQFCSPRWNSIFLSTLVMLWFRNFYNWTWNYRLDSDIVDSYGYEIVPKRQNPRRWSYKAQWAKIHQKSPIYYHFKIAEKILSHF